MPKKKQSKTSKQKKSQKLEWKQGRAKKQTSNNQKRYNKYRIFL